MSSVNHLVCLDLEGVLVPELWVHVAQHYQLPQLRKTTREIPDYSELMQLRLTTLQHQRISLSDLQQVIASVEPLDGAREFLDTLRRRTQVLIVSDTFIEFFAPLSHKLNYPCIFCNRLEVDADGMIRRHVMRHPHGKEFVVELFQRQGFTVSAAGDSYNDVGMLQRAQQGCFLHAPENISSQFPHLKSYHSYQQLLQQWEPLFDWPAAC